MGFLDRLRAYRLEQRKANKSLDENYYYSDGDLSEIIDCVTRFFSPVQKLAIADDMDIEEMRYFVEDKQVRLLGYNLKHKSEKYSVANRSMYYGV